MWKNIDIKTSKRVVRYACIVFSVGCVIIGYGMRVFNVLCIAMVTFLFHNILYAFENIKTRIWFLIMHITIFTFLISRPFISMLRGEAWWERTSQKPENIVFSITAIMISMFMMYIGAVIAEHVLSTKKTIEKEGKKQFRDNLQAVSMVVFYITMVFFLIQEGEKLLFMHGKTYVEFYSGFQSKLPGGFLSIASLMRYSLCIFLATFPNKRRTFIALALYEISAIPQLLIGVRNPIILNSLFIFLYYFLRDSIGDEKKWIGKIEKLLLMIGIPFGVVFMSVFAYIRSGLKIAQLNIFKLFIDFFYGQGVTFDVLGIVYGHRLNLPMRDWRNYTFGGMIDYIVHGRIGQALWGTEALPSNNCWANGRLSNNLSHNFAYLYMEEDYLKGRGYGSSYLLENYIDFGYIGVIVFSLILGILLIYMLQRIGKNTLVDTIVLVSLTTIFFIPRAEATGWLTFIVTAQFWICIIACYMAAYICKNVSIFQKLLSYLKLYPRE
mgnify:CR=1 FL=1